MYKGKVVVEQLVILDVELNFSQLCYFVHAHFGYRAAILMLNMHQGLDVDAREDLLGFFGVEAGTLI